MCSWDQKSAASATSSILVKLDCQCASLTLRTMELLNSRICSLYCLKAHSAISLQSTNNDELGWSSLAIDDLLLQSSSWTCQEKLPYADQLKAYPAASITAIHNLSAVNSATFFKHRP